MAININGTGSITGLSSISSPTISGGSVPLGDATAPGIVFSGDANTGIYSPGADQVAISTNSTGRLFIDSSGRVGVGTSTPGELLHLASGSSPAIRIKNTNAGVGTFSQLQLATANSFDEGRVVLKGISENAGNNSVTFAVETSAAGGSPTEKLRITSAGLVGIGTSSPVYLVDAQGGRALFTANSETYSVGVRNRASLAPNGNFWIGATNAVSPDMVFSNNAGNERMRITDGGNVGIGSTSPSEKLTLSDGNIRLDSTTSTSKHILFYDTAGLRHVIGSDATAGTNEFGLRTEGQIVFGAGSGRGEAVRIDASKRLLVGTSTGSEKLRVAGQIQIGNGTSGGGGGGFVRTTQSTATGSSHTIAIADYAPNGSGDDFSGFMVITAQFTGYPGKTAVGTYAIGKNTGSGVSVTQLSNTKIGMTTFTVGTSGNDITVTTDSSCKVSCVFMGGQ